MPTISHSGSLPATSSFPDNQTPTTTSDILDGQEFIRSSGTERTAINPETYRQTLNQLQGYIEGSRTKVTYYLVANMGPNNRSQVMDAASMRHSVNVRYIQYINFEITLLDGGIDHTYDPATSESQLRGTAATYPGIAPSVGDVFVMPIGDNQYGIFSVTEVDALTYFRAKAHRITYVLREYVTDLAIDTLKSQVKETYYFDKKLYLDTGVLLQSDRYITLQTLRQMRDIFSAHYVNTFYHADLGSIVDPSGVYDPYLVEYLHKKIAWSVGRVRPDQLWPPAKNAFKHTLWARLLDVKNLSPLGLWSTAQETVRVLNTYSAQITPLINRRYRILVDPAATSTSTPEPYVFSAAFYTGTVVDMTPLESLVYESVTTAAIADLDALVALINDYQTLTPSEQFYRLPVYLHLIDVGLAVIGGPS